MPVGFRQRYRVRGVFGAHAILSATWIPQSDHVFNSVTEATSQRCLRGGPADQPDTFENIVSRWAHLHQIDLSEYRDNVGALRIQSLMVCPIAHATLVASRLWTTWAFPFLSGVHRRGHKYDIGAKLWQGYRPEWDGGHNDADVLEDVGLDAFGPADFQEVADMIRHLLSNLPAGGNQLLRADAEDKA